ncbi:hypothetical protein RND71_009380 [Anisodus tanguticus]|uniref:Uncharacterized protein n=1 Tax=Anisodus tanguticus TaxID=243964 RepID=A0AAE1SHM7_9SOLA|nr:hypothetical protein RND71_009380 [Anisodus tanguticus]
MLKRPYLRGNPGILPQGIVFHKSKGRIVNHDGDDIDPIIGESTSNPYFINLKHNLIALKRPYLRGNPVGLLPRGVTFHKAISTRNSANLDKLGASPNSNTNFGDLKKNSIVLKRPYLRGNPGLLPQGVTFHKAISPRLSENYGNTGLLPQRVTFHKAISPRLSEINGEVVSPATRKISNTNFGDLKKNSIVLKRPYLRGNPRLLPQRVTFHKAISPSLSETNGEAVSPATRKISNTNFGDLKKNSIVLKRPYLRGNPGLLPQGVTFHKAISPRLSENYGEAVSPTTRKISNTNFGDLKKNSIVLKRPYLRGNPGLLPQSVTFHKAISPRLSENYGEAVSPATRKISNTNFGDLKKNSNVLKRSFLRVSPATRKISNTNFGYLKKNSIVLKRPYLRGNPRLLPQRVTFHKAISPRLSENYGEAVSPATRKISNTNFGDLKKNSIVLKRPYLRGLSWHVSSADLSEFYSMPQCWAAMEEMMVCGYKISQILGGNSGGDGCCKAINEVSSKCAFDGVNPLNLFIPAFVKDMCFGNNGDLFTPNYPFVDDPYGPLKNAKLKKKHVSTRKHHRTLPTRRGLFVPNYNLFP